MSASRRVAVLIACAVAFVSLPVTPAHALFHLMKVTEVFAGTAEQPNAQFVELQMYADGQRFVATHEIVVFDASGAEAGTFTFTSPLANGASQSYVLIATAEAEALFGVPADLEMTPAMAGNGGRACFRDNQGDLIDCASWGNYTGDHADSGTPFNAPIGLVGGQSMTRKTTAGNPNALDEADDTNNSSADFEFADPSPTNNAGDTAGVTSHDRTVTLTLKGRSRLVAIGKVTAEGDFEACFAEVPVRLQRRKSGRWVTVKESTTDGTGSYRVAAKDRPGTYRTKAPELEPSKEHRCNGATSPKRKRS